MYSNEGPSKVKSISLYISIRTMTVKGGVVNFTLNFLLRIAGIALALHNQRLAGQWISYMDLGSSLTALSLSISICKMRLTTWLL